MSKVIGIDLGTTNSCVAFTNRSIISARGDWIDHNLSGLRMEAEKLHKEQDGREFTRTALLKIMRRQ